MANFRSETARAASGGRWERGGDGAPRFVAYGDLDYAALDRVAEAMWAQPPGSAPRVEIDLGAVGYFDTAVARVLERYRQEAADNEAEVRVVSASRYPRTVLRLTGLSGLLDADRD